MQSRKIIIEAKYDDHTVWEYHYNSIKSFWPQRYKKKVRDPLAKPIKMQHFNFALIIYWEIITNTCITMRNCNNHLTCKSTVKRVSQRKGPCSFLIIRVCLSGFSIRDSHTSPMATRLSWCSLISSSTPSRSCQKIMKTAINVGTWVIKETSTCICIWMSLLGSNSFAWCIMT